MRPLVHALFAVLLASLPALAQVEPPKDDPRLDQLEEQVLRAQVEGVLNGAAHWDSAQRRVVFNRIPGGGRERTDLGPMQPMAELFLSRMIEPDGNGRLRIKPGVKLEPFARVAQDYLAEGGGQDVEAFERYRRGEGENPFKNGIPPRVSKAVAGLLRALNQQDFSSGPRRASDGDDRDDDGEKDEPAPAPKKAERPRASERWAGIRKDLQDFIRDESEMDPEELEAIERYLGDLAKQLQEDADRLRRDLGKRAKEFRESDEGRDLEERAERLRRRAEDELRRALESPDTRKRLDEVQQRALEFFASPEGQEMERRIMEFLSSDRGRELRDRVQKFLDSDRGRELLDRLSERFNGRPKGDRRPGERDSARKNFEAWRKSFEDAEQKRLRDELKDRLDNRKERESRRGEDRRERKPESDPEAF